MVKYHQMTLNSNSNTGMKSQIRTRIGTPHGLCIHILPYTSMHSSLPQEGIRGRRSRTGTNLLEANSTHISPLYIRRTHVCMISVSGWGERDHLLYVRSSREREKKAGQKDRICKLKKPIEMGCLHPALQHVSCIVPCTYSKRGVGKREIHNSG